MSKPSNHNPEPSPPAETEFDLSLEDTAAQKSRTLGRNGGAGAGYNPYDATPDGVPATAHVSRAAAPTSAEPKRKPTDLRKLSEWIRLRRQVEALKSEKPESK